MAQTEHTIIDAFTSPTVDDRVSALENQMKSHVHDGRETRTVSIQGLLGSLLNTDFLIPNTDGDLHITSGTTTLTADKYYNNLIIDSGATLATANFRVFAKSILNNGTISSNGNNGGNAGSNGGSAVSGTLPAAGGGGGGSKGTGGGIALGGGLGGENSSDVTGGSISRTVSILGGNGGAGESVAGGGAGGQAHRARRSSSGSASGINPGR